MKFRIVLLCLALGIVAWPTHVDTIPRKAVGLQLYSLRDQFKKDVAQTLDQVRALSRVNDPLRSSTLRQSERQTRGKCCLFFRVAGHPRRLSFCGIATM